MNAEEKGFIQLNRSILDLPLTSVDGWLFVQLLMMVHYKDAKKSYTFNGRVVSPRRGQMITSYDRILDYTHRHSKNQLRNLLNGLADKGLISVDKGNNRCDGLFITIQWVGFYSIGKTSNGKPPDLPPDEQFDLPPDLPPDGPSDLPPDAPPPLDNRGIQRTKEKEEFNTATTMAITENPGGSKAVADYQNSNYYDTNRGVDISDSEVTLRMISIPSKETERSGEEIPSLNSRFFSAAPVPPVQPAPPPILKSLLVEPSPDKGAAPKFLNIEARLAELKRRNI